MQNEVGTGGGADSGTGSAGPLINVTTGTTGGGKNVITDITDLITGGSIINIDDVKAQVMQLRPSWEVLVGGVKRLLKERGGKIPSDDVVRLNYYMTEFQTIFDKKEWTNYDLGDFIALKIVAVAEGIEKIFQDYAPQLLKYIPGVLTIL